MDGPEMVALQDAVTATEGVQASAGVLLTEFAKYVAAHKTDPAALQAFADRIVAANTALGAAIAANPDPDPAD